MVDIMISLVLVIIFAAAGWKIYTDKKKGAKCAGCPHADLAGKNCNR